MTAMRELMNKPYCGSREFRERQNRARRIGVYCDPASGRFLIGEFEKAFVSKLRKRGMPFYAHNMVRTWEEQDALFDRKVSKARGGQSPHNYGMAVDVVHCERHWDLSEEAWEIVGHTGKEVAKRLRIDIEWGGDWSFYDPAHWELAGWKAIVQNTAPF